MKKNIYYRVAVLGSNYLSYRNERKVDIQGYLTYGQKADDTITLQI